MMSFRKLYLKDTLNDFVKDTQHRAGLFSHVFGCNAK